MIRMKLHILGCHAATPRTMTNPTSQVLEVKNECFLIDCGEGTQVELRKNKIKFSRIRHVFISHLHGDHFFGLPGLISTFKHLGRKQELHVHGPKGIKEAITLLLKLGNSWTDFPLYFHELSETKPVQIWEEEWFTVKTIPLQHRIYTNGFLFTFQQGDKPLNVEAAEAYGVDKTFYRNIKKGKDVVMEDGSVIKNELLTFDAPPPKKYAYCSDTAYSESIIPYIEKADVLYHESTFLESETRLTTKTGHSTAREAAMIAREAGVKQLILGHYSTRYNNLGSFLEEASAVFPNVVLAEDGKTFEF